METFLQKVKTLFRDKTLRRRVLVVLGALVLFRLLAAIPIPGIDTARLDQFLSQNEFLGVLNVFSGGGLSNLSIIMLGVGPYITGSIIMQLLTIMVPKLKSLYQEEGEIGRKKFAQYSRMLTVPLAALQGFSLLVILEQQGILNNLDAIEKVANLLVIIAGSMLLMWIGELVTEFGIGNGLSLIIFAGIVSQMPTEIGQMLFTFNVAQVPAYIAFAVVGILVIFGVILITEAERPIPVTYARRATAGGQTGGVSTYLPIRINQAGVMPIIFALSILLFPQLIGSALAASTNGTLKAISTALLTFNQSSWLYLVLYFLFVFIFTYFYTAITFDPKQMADNLQKNGAFVPGVRPGGQTETYVGDIVGRITLVGGLFLAIVAILPLLMQKFTGIGQVAIGGTALLIVVSVVIDLVKRIDSQLSMREY
jgi:preprotein translocase subunit SecY